MIWLALGIVVAVTAVVLVALPFLREPVAADDRLDAKTEADERRLALVEERDRALAALKELEFDHQTGKVTDDDYRALVGQLRRTAAEALKALDRPARYGPRMSEPTSIETPTPVPEPGPPPDEGTPPTPAPVPEPYPPPDEATPPAPPAIPEPSPQE